MAQKKPTGHAKIAARWDERGARLAGLDAVISAEASADEWIELIGKIGLQVDETPSAAEGPSFAASFAALPKKTRNAALYLTGDVHSVKDEPGIAHWHLRWRASPKSTPPAQLTEASIKVGGYPGVLERMSSNWPCSLDVSVTAHVTYEIDTRRFKSYPGRAAAKPKQINVETSGASHVMKPSLVMASWGIDPPIGCVNSISVMRVEGMTTIIGGGNLTVRLGPQIKELIDAALWSNIRTFLEDSKGELK